MVNSGSFDSDGQGDRNAKVGCTQPHNASDSTQSSSPVTASAAVATCKSGFSQTADSDLPSVAHAIEPTPTKTEFNSNMPIENVTDLSTLYESVVESDKSLVSSSSSSIEDEKTSLCCSLPLDKVQGVLTSYQPTQTDEDVVRPKPIRKLLCLYCDRSFVSANLRQKHVERIHSAKQNRRVSSRRHNQFTVTPCVYCDKLNATENTLKDLFLHLINEHSSKYFGCLPCEDRFFTSSLLADHNAYNHPSNIESPSNNQNQTTFKAALIQPHLKNVKDESSEEHEDVPIKITRSRVKPKPEEPQTSVKFKEMRNKKLTVKSSRLALKKRESKRIQAIMKTADTQKKRRPKPIDRKHTNTNKMEQNNSTKSPEKTKSNVSCVNPYPEFDNFYRVKKITDHSIDNLKISSLTFDDVFDKAFFNRIKCNIEENLLHHIDGKLFKNEESENRISNFEKVSNVPQEMLNSNPENYGCELSLNAVTPVASLSLNSQYGEDFESQIEYGSKPSKKKTQIKKDEVHYKYFTRRKYQASILEHKENRDLSKLDMWTQLVIKKRQQKMLDEKKSAKEIMEYTTGDEYKSKMQREELNRILDRRGPFEDLREEASKKAALDKLNWSTVDNISHESFSEVRQVLNQIINQVFTITERSSMKSENDTVETSSLNKKQDQREIPSYLKLRRSSSLPCEGEIDKSDKIALICSSQETENYELPTNQVRAKNELIELSGEWARCRMYICAACGAKLPNMKYLLDHKSMYHQNVWVQHYEFVGNQSELYRHLSIPVLGKVGKVEETVQCKLWRRSEARLCTKCDKQCNSLGELHRHILECGGDWTWMLVRKKCKYRPFGAKSRRKRRGLVSRIYHKQKTEPTEKKKYKKTFEGPRQRPSDADTIQRMLANLPAKRSTRKLISFQEGIYRSKKKQQIQNLNQKKVKCGKVIYTSSNIKENAEKTINASRVSKKPQSSTSSSRRSLRSLNKVLSSRILDTNAKLTVKRKLKVLSDRRRTRKNLIDIEKEESTEVEVEENNLNDPALLSESAKPLARGKKETATLKRSSRILTKNIKNISVKKLLTGKINIKSFFPVKKRKSRKVILENADVESTNDEDIAVEDISTRSKRRLKDAAQDKNVEPQDSDKKVEPLVKLQTKKTKHNTLRNLVRTLSVHKNKNSENPKPTEKHDIECEVRAEVTTDFIEKEKKSEELDKTSKKRKLKHNFKKVLNKVKRLKIDNNPSTQSMKPSRENEEKKSTYIPFLDKANILEPSVVLQEKIIIPSTLEAKENLADISKTALTVITHQTKENPPIPETIFRLEPKIEESLQAKGELNFDALPISVFQDNVLDMTNLKENNSSTTLPKIGPISIETSVKPKVVPLISPNMKGKIRKPSRGLNDCIAMLTSKLQQKTEVVPKADTPINITAPNKEIVKPLLDQTPHKTECILKIPTFKSNLTAATEDIALDLSTKKKVNEDERPELLNLQKNQCTASLNINRSKNSVDRIIEDVVGNKVHVPETQNVWNSVDDTIQKVIDTHQNIDIPILIRDTVDDIIDFVIANKDNSRENEKCVEKMTKSTRKIGSIRKIKGKVKKIANDTSDEKIIIQSNNFDGEIAFLEPKNIINMSECELKKSNEVDLHEKQESLKDSLDASVNVENENNELNNGLINIIKETTQKTARRNVGNQFRKIGEPRHSRGRKKKIFETNLDKIFDVDEIKSNPAISTKNINSDCKDIKFSNEDEPHIMENKTLELQATTNTRLSESDDDIPLAILAKVNEVSKSGKNITSDVGNLSKTKPNDDKNNGQNTVISDTLQSKHVVCKSQEVDSIAGKTSATNLAPDVDKLEEHFENPLEMGLNTEINKLVEITSSSNEPTTETVNVDNIDGNLQLSLQSILLPEEKTANESLMENTNSEKSDIIDNEVLKEQTNNLTEILDDTRDEIVLDKTVQIVKDEKLVKKLSKSPKSPKKRLNKSIDKLTGNNHTIGNLKIYVESTTHSQKPLVFKKKVKNSDKDIFHMNSENITKLTKPIENGVSELDTLPETVCSNTATLSNVSVKSDELLNNLFETLTANTKLPDVCSIKSELLIIENEKHQNILDLVRKTFNKPKTVRTKPKSKLLRKSKSTTEICKKVDNNSLSKNVEIIPRKITRSRSLKNLQHEEKVGLSISESDNSSFSTVPMNIFEKIKSVSDLSVLEPDLSNQTLFSDIIDMENFSKNKLCNQVKTHEKNNLFNDNYSPSQLNIDNATAFGVEENDDIIDDNKIPKPDDTIINSNKCNKLCDNDERESKQYINNGCEEPQRNNLAVLVDNSHENVLVQQNIDKKIESNIDDEEIPLLENSKPTEDDALDYINDTSEIICDQGSDNKQTSKIRKKSGRKKKNPEKDDASEATATVESPKRVHSIKTFENGCSDHVTNISVEDDIQTKIVTDNVSPTTNPHDLNKSNKLKIILNKTNILIEQFPDVLDRLNQFPYMSVENTCTPKNKLVDSATTKLNNLKIDRNTYISLDRHEESNLSSDAGEERNLDDASANLENYVDKSEDMQLNLDNLDTRNIESHSSRRNDATFLSNVSILLENNINQGVTEEFKEIELESNRTRKKIARTNDSTETCTTNNSNDISNVLENSRDDNLNKDFLEIQSKSSNTRIRRLRSRSARKSDLTDGSSTDTLYDMSVIIDFSKCDKTTQFNRSNSTNTRSRRSSCRAVKNNVSTEGTSEDISEDMSVGFNYSTDDTFTKDLTGVESDSNDSRIRRPRSNPSRKHNLTEVDIANISLAFDESTGNNITKDLAEIESDSDDSKIRKLRLKNASKTDLDEVGSAILSSAFGDGTEDNFPKNLVKVESYSSDSRIRKPRGRPVKKKESSQENGVNVALTKNLAEIDSPSNDLRIRKPRGISAKKTYLADGNGKNISIVLDDTTDDATKDSAEVESDSNDSKIKKSVDERNAENILNACDDTTYDNVIKDLLENESDSNDWRNRKPAEKNDLAEENNENISNAFEESIGDNFSKELAKIESDLNYSVKRSAKNSNFTEGNGEIFSNAFDDTTDDNVTKDLEEIASNLINSTIIRSRGRQIKNDITEVNSANISNSSDDTTNDNTTEKWAGIESDSNDFRIRRSMCTSTKTKVTTEGNVESMLNAFDDTINDNVIKVLAKMESDSNNPRIKKSRGRNPKKYNLTKENFANNSEESSVVIKDNTNENELSKCVVSNSSIEKHSENDFIGDTNYINKKLVDNHSISNAPKVGRSKGRLSRNMKDAKTKEFVETLSNSNHTRVRRPRNNPTRNKAMKKRSSDDFSEDSIDSTITKQFFEPHLEEFKNRKLREKISRKDELTGSSTHTSQVFEDISDNNISEELKLDDSQIQIVEDIVQRGINDKNTNTSLSIQKRNRKTDLTEPTSEKILDDVSADFENSSVETVRKEIVEIQPESNMCKSTRSRSESLRKNELLEISSASLAGNMSENLEITRDDNIAEEYVSIHSESNISKKNKRTRSLSSRKRDFNEQTSRRNASDGSLVLEADTVGIVVGESRNRRTTRKGDQTELSNTDDNSFKVQVSNDVNGKKELTEMYSDSIVFKTRRTRPRSSQTVGTINVFNDFSAKEDEITNNYLSNQSNTRVPKHRRTRSASTRKTDLTRLSGANILHDIIVDFDHNTQKQSTETLNPNDIRIGNISPRPEIEAVIGVGSAESVVKVLGELETNVNLDITKDYSDIVLDSINSGAGSQTTTDGLIDGTISKISENNALKLENSIQNNVTQDYIETQSDSNTSKTRQTKSAAGSKNMINCPEETIKIHNIDVPGKQANPNNSSTRRNRPRFRRKDLIKVRCENTAGLETTTELELNKPKLRKYASVRSRSKKDMSRINVKGNNKRSKSSTNKRDKYIIPIESVVDETDSEIAHYFSNQINQNHDSCENEKNIQKEILNENFGEENELKRSRSSRNKAVINYSENDEIDKRNISDDIIIPNLKDNEHLKSFEISIDSEKNINKRHRNNRSKKGSSLNTKLNGKMAVDVNGSVEDIKSAAEATDVQESITLNVTEAPSNIDNSESLHVKKIDEPPIKIIINKHKTRRKSKSFRKIDSKGQNDLFEDFALVIKKPKGTAPIITFSPADTFSKDTYPNYITETPLESTTIVDEQILEEKTDVSVEEMDMELDELPITSSIIENTNVTLTLPIETPESMNISNIEQISDKWDNIPTKNHPKKNRKKKVSRKNKKTKKPNEDLPLESVSFNVDLCGSLEYQEQQLADVIQVPNKGMDSLCSMDDVSNNPVVLIDDSSELMKFGENEDDISKEVNKLILKKSNRTSKSKKTIDSNIPVVMKDVQCFNDTLQLEDNRRVEEIPPVVPFLGDSLIKNMGKVAEEIYAFTEIEDLEIEQPLEIPKRLPRKETKSFTDIESTKQAQEVDKAEQEITTAPSCEESLSKQKQKPKSIKEIGDESDIINTSNVIEESQGAGRRPARTAKVKALEHIHDDALADLTDTEKIRVSRKVEQEENKPSSIITKKNKKPQPTEENDTTGGINKKIKKQKKGQNIVEAIDILEEKTPSLADLVADLEGLEELENSIERELNAEIDKNITDLNQDLATSNKDLDNEGNKELRRSRRGSRKLGSYNENDILEPIFDAIAAKRKGRKKEEIDKNQTTKEQAKKLNSDELFDLLKASTTDENVPKSHIFLNSIEDSSTNLNESNNLSGMFENILEKSSLIVHSNVTKQPEQNYVAKLSEKAEAEKKDKSLNGNHKNSHKRKNISVEKNELSDSGTSSLFPPDQEETNSEVYSKSKKVDKHESNFCDICNKSFIRLENLIKHKRTITHIQKLSEIEAKQAHEKSILEQKQIESQTSNLIEDCPNPQENLQSSKIDININDILLDSEKPTENHSPVVHSSFSNSHSLKLADIINDVLNKPHLENESNDDQGKFSDIIVVNNTSIQPEFKRYKSLGERKSFDSDKMVSVDNQATSVEEPYISKTTILEKQISLLENIIENQTGISYIDEISMSSNISERRCNSESSLKQDDSTTLPCKVARKPSNNDGSFLKPTQYDEISEDSANLKTYEDQKLRKTLNRDEELFLECCSLLKSGSEVSSYSNKRSQNKIKVNSACTEELEWQERRELQKPEFNVIEEYSDDNSRIPTPLGDSYADDESNSNTISSNWGMTEQEADTRNDPQTSFNLDKVLNCENNTKMDDIQVDSEIAFLEDSENASDTNVRTTNAAKKIVTKGARKVYEGLKVSIPTEDLNMEEVLNSNPKSKKNELENTSIIATLNINRTDDSESPQQTKPSRTARKSKPVKKSQIGSNLLFKINKKKVPSPNTTPAKLQSSEVDGKRDSYDVYDFEETQDNSDIFTKPDFRAFRNMKNGEGVEPESDSESRDYLDPLSVERDSITSTSVSSHSSLKKPKAQENITKKKCMIMGRIFKNAAKSKIEDIDEEIRSIPEIDNEQLVETYVASCKRVIKNEAKPKLSEKEINQLFDQLLEDKNIENDSSPVSPVAKMITKSKPECKKVIENKKRTKVKNRKRVRTNSDSTDDEFQLNNISKRAYRKNAKSEDNCINLEQELKECIGVASRKSQRKCTSGKQNVLVEYWSSDESQFEALLETQRIETVPNNKNPAELENVVAPSPKDLPMVNNEDIKKVAAETVDKISKPKTTERKLQHKKKSSVDKKEKSNIQIESVKTSDTVTSNRRKRAAANPLYHWSSSSEDESQDLIEVKPLRDEIEDDEERPIQHGWIVGDSPKKLVTMLAQAKGKKTDIDCVKEQGKKRTNAVS